MTQSEVASIAEVDVRTVLNIENYKGNPKFEVLCSIIRTLNLDTQEIFYPEMGRESAPLTYLQQIIGGCTDEEAEMLIQIVTSVLSALRDKNSKKVEQTERACLSIFRESRLCALSVTLYCLTPVLISQDR